MTFLLHKGHGGETPWAKAQDAPVSPQSFPIYDMAKSSIGLASEALPRRCGD
jgi:hypothetical protein